MLVNLHVVHDLESSYPVAWTLGVAAFSALGGRAALVALGDRLVKKAATWEDANLAAAGLSPDQRKLVLEDQARAAERAAADLRAVAAAIVVATPAPPAP